MSLEYHARRMDDQTEPPLDARWQAVQAAVAAWVRASTAADKLLRGVTSAARDPQAARAALDALTPLRAVIDDAALAPTALAELHAQTTAAVDSARLRWLGDLASAAEAAGLAQARVGTDEVRIDEATVRVDHARGEVDVLYAREVLATVRPDPVAVVDAVRTSLAALRRPVEQVPDIFEEIAAAYRVLLARQGLPVGERVNLVDLVAPLFFVRQADTFWKRPDARSARLVTRAQLAYDLDTLQRARRLEHGGLRIALGSATGGSTAKKQQVLFLESAPGGGQYYLTFALRPVETP